MSDDLNDILDDLGDLAEGESEISVDDVVEKVGARGQGAFLLVPGLIGMTPIGGIPGVPTVLGVLLAILAGQILVGKQQIWTPGPIGRRSVDHNRVRKAVGKLRSPSRWIDRHFGERLKALTGQTANRIAAALCLIFAIALPPLEVLPFVALIPFTAIALLGLALTLRDGVLMAVAFAVSAGAFYGLWSFMPWFGGG